MIESISTVPMESSSSQLDALRQEGHFREAKLSEKSFVPEDANSRIVEHIKDGMTPEHIEMRLESDLQQPEVQRQLINEFSPYSEQVNKFIRTTQELSVYTGNGCQESKIIDRPSLQMKIDPERTDAMGRSNTERVAAGRSPIDENGDTVNLHHIGQKEDSPLAELPDRVHKEFDVILHDKSKPTEVHGEGNNWNEVRAQYWRERSLTL